MTAQQTAWIVEDDDSIRWVLNKALQKAGLQVSTYTDADSAWHDLQQTQPDVILSDIRMPGMDGIRLLENIRSTYPELPVIIMTAHADLDSAVSAYHSGAFEYLPKPFDIAEAVAQVQRACRQRQAITPTTVKTTPPGTAKLIGAAPAMQIVFRTIGRLARSNITVLIHGESGTGKERVAHALHQHSHRADGPFIALNMAAIPHELLESELFGHEKGAFTGAHSRRQGRFEQARQGTLFLDEIGDMPAALQTRLLRVLSDGEYYRVGGREALQADVRIIAATHQNLQQQVAQGEFREDLYHRLNVACITLPALRERTEDIPALLQQFLHSAGRELRITPKTVLPQTLTTLQQYAWPGNVRQLENVARWLTAMAAGDTIHPEDLPPDLQPTDSSQTPDWHQALRTWAQDRLAQGDTALLQQAVPAFETILLEAALSHTSGHKQAAAQILGWGRNTLARKIKELNLTDS
ncbi:MAG: nitrogen regulation protein NR(I) [Pseudomonadota bacterium]